MDPRTHLPKDCPPRLTQLKVDVPVTSVRREASNDSPQDTELLFGDLFDVHKIHGEWAWGQSQNPVTNSDYPGYIGWIRMCDMSEVADSPTHIIISLKAPVFRSDNIKSPIETLLPMGARVSGEEGGTFLKTSKGYIHTRHIRAIGRAPHEADYVKVAERFLGLPYIWGGVSTHGLDCSGLVMSGLRAVGRDAPRDSDMQIAMGTEIALDDALRRGDLIFWKGHVGIMQDRTTLLHANAYHMCVASEPLDEACARIKKTAGEITARRRIL